MNIPANTPPGTKFCFWVAFSPYDNAGDTNGYSNPQCFTVAAAPPVLTCDDIDFKINPADIEPNTKFRTVIDANFDTDVSAIAAYGFGSRAYVKVSGPGIVATTYYTTTAPTTNQMQVAHTYGPTGVTGNYTISYGLTGYTDPVLGIVYPQVDCPAGGGGHPFEISYLPYFGVRGGDVTAGADFGAGCSQSDTANIESWNNDGTNPISGASGDYTGAGTNMGVLTSTGEIRHFVTANNLGSGISNVGSATVTSPHALAFANDTTTRVFRFSVRGSRNDFRELTAATR